MGDSVEFLARGAIIGAGASALMDAWGLLAGRAFNIHGLDYAMLGRWIGHFPRGRFFHERMASADPVRGERPLGGRRITQSGSRSAVALSILWI